MLKFNSTKKTGRRPSFLNIELQRTEKKTNENAPDHWGRSRCSVNTLQMYERAGLDEVTLQRLRQFHAEAGVGPYGFTFSVGGWDSQYDTGREYIHITANSFVDAEGNFIDEGDGEAEAEAEVAAA